MTKASDRTKRTRPPPSSRVRRVVAAAVIPVALAAAVLLGSPALAQDGPPDFSMVAYQGEAELGGTELDFSELFGNGRPVVLNFWAALCPPCRQEMPGFQRVHEELGKRFIMLGVDLGPFIGLGTHDQARALLEELEISYPAAYAASIDPVRDYGVRGMPTTIFLDADGEIVKKHTGYLPEAQLHREIEALLETAE